MAPSGIDIDGLRKLYAESPAAAAAFDHFAGRQNNSSITKLDRIVNVLRFEGHDVSRHDMIDFFRGIEAAKCGRFVVGRKGHPTRLEWSCSLIDVGQAAAGETNEVEELSEAQVAEAADEDAGLVEHRFRLRPGLEVAIELPEDLTTTEAARLSDFVKTLPYGE